MTDRILGIFPLWLGWEFYITKLQRGTTVGKAHAKKVRTATLHIVASVIQPKRIPLLS
jgi:hypothetical protein